MKVFIELIRLLDLLKNEIEKCGIEIDSELKGKMDDILSSIDELMQSNNESLSLLKKIEDDINVSERYIFGELGQEENIGKYFIRIEKGTDIENYITNYFKKISGSEDKAVWANYMDTIKNTEVFLFNDDAIEWDKYTIDRIEFNTTNYVIRPIEPSTKMYKIGTKVKLKMWKVK